ncbi:hypothetical protein PVL30_003771 [Lodderomyces elongisporus]|uniref:uncharacterized protein n=1 Tax=Lodderomyces elongisporus TaxID=36914 RepID=UPI0029215D77|nr:uncharacterized protein PVL30_003771 [Lodderomyces elongisporus]WLF80003.1 hypothetical protein PVL30_003771 [Lodderomyces elongisporus]
MICALSGLPIQNPVASPKSGSVFEKKYIEKYVLTSGKDPINDEPLTIGELISLRITPLSQTSSIPGSLNGNGNDSSNPNNNSNSNINNNDNDNNDINIIPPAPATSSIPSLLSTLQNEWDSIVLELFTLRKTVQSLKQQLSMALYRADASVNVAAKALRERDQARREIERLVLSLEVKPEEKTEDKDNIDEEKINTGDGVLQQIQEAKEKLFIEHKSKKVKFPYTANKFRFASVSEANGVFKVKLDASDLLEKHVRFETLNKTISLVHENEVISYSLFDNLFTKWQTSSKDDITKFCINSHGVIAAAYGSTLEFSTGAKFGIKAAEIVAHPELNLFVVFTETEYLITNGQEVLFKKNLTFSTDLAAIHVDGQLIALDDKKQISLFDLVSGEVVGSVPYVEHTISTSSSKTRLNRSVIQIQFAANGYWLFILSDIFDGTIDKDHGIVSVIQVIDLRKIAEVKKFEFDFKVDNFVIDPTSTVLFVNNEDGISSSIYSKKTKTWSAWESVEFAEGMSKGKNVLRLFSNVDDIAKNQNLELVHLDGYNDVCRCLRLEGV